METQEETPLPKELYFECLLFLSLQDIATFRLVSKSWCSLVDDPWFWNLYVEQELGPLKDEERLHLTNNSFSPPGRIYPPLYKMRMEDIWEQQVRKSVPALNTSKLALCGKKGVIWGMTEGTGLTKEEALIIGTKQPDYFWSDGYTIAGTKYVTCKSDEMYLLGQVHRTSGFSSYCVRTKTLVLVALIEHPAFAFYVRGDLERIGDRLLGMGY